MRPSSLLLPAAAALSLSTTTVAAAKPNGLGTNISPGSLDLSLPPCSKLHNTPSPQPHAVSESATAHAAAATQKQHQQTQPVINSTARKVIGGIAVAVLVGVI